MSIFINSCICHVCNRFFVYILLSENSDFIRGTAERKSGKKGQMSDLSNGVSPGAHTDTIRMSKKVEVITI